MVGGGRGALIGAAHRRAARLDGEFDLVAGAFSSTLERSRASGADLGIGPDRCYGDFREMAILEAARQDGIEAVAIVTPNHLHAPATAAFLEAGIHVICDKPVTATLPEALALEETVKRSGRLFCLTHNYSAYAMVRQAAAMIAAGELGALRAVQVEYLSGFLAKPVENANKQAAWRTDPAKAGGGAIGDIGSHAWHLLRVVTGLRVERLAADLSALVPGRRIDDHAQVLLRFKGGARGCLVASHVAAGAENDLRIRVFGETGGLEWSQNDPEILVIRSLDGPCRIIQRGSGGTGPQAARLGRMPAGHPEGYFEAFANVYRDAAEAIRLSRNGTVCLPQDRAFASIEEGVDVMRFIDACLRSTASDAAWTTLADPDDQHR
ncbi:MAG: Gfo/Idh/MocA family oxidoreductase [Rhodobacteraceae bacterium]|nr:Gfo/Idh/MocA family oxidoreductase [Paracoccaceae bacterium]